MHQKTVSDRLCASAWSQKDINVRCCSFSYTHKRLTGRNIDTHAYTNIDKHTCTHTGIIHNLRILK